jgi:hypothetical protein
LFVCFDYGHLNRGCGDTSLCKTNTSYSFRMWLSFAKKGATLKILPVFNINGNEVYFQPKILLFKL